MGDRITLGPIFWIFGVLLGLVMTFALLFLGIVEWEVLALPAIFGWGGGLLVIAVCGRVGLTREGVANSNVLVAAMIGLLVLFAQTMLFQAWLGLSLTVANEHFWLVNVLFAIYEETLFLGVAAAGKAAKLPDMYIIGLSAIVFVPWHALRYPVDMLMYILILGGARVVMSALTLATDHSDPSYITHISWNVLSSIF